MTEDDEVTAARIAIGLPRNRYAFPAAAGGPGVPIVCKCMECGTLFGGHSGDLADLNRIIPGDCGRPWQH